MGCHENNTGFYLGFSSNFQKIFLNQLEGNKVYNFFFSFLLCKLNTCLWLNFTIFQGMYRDDVELNAPSSQLFYVKLLSPIIMICEQSGNSVWQGIRLCYSGYIRYR